jgi:hypothetical protein
MTCSFIRPTPAAVFRKSTGTKKWGNHAKLKLLNMPPQTIPWQKTSEHLYSLPEQKGFFLFHRERCRACRVASERFFKTANPNFAVPRITPPSFCQQPRDRQAGKGVSGRGPLGLAR